MRRYFILLLVFLSSGYCGVAQTVWFEAEGKNHYRVSGDFNPGSDIQFGVNTDGGKIIKSFVLKNDGTALLVTGKDFKPEFILNDNKLNKDGIRGTGMVEYLNEKLFYLDALELSIPNLTLDWKAQVNSSERLVFEVVFTGDGKDLVINTLEVGSTNGIQEFQTILPSLLSEMKGYITIRVLKGKNELYKSSNLKVGNSLETLVYPTVVTTSITIKAEQPDVFQIVDVQGKLVKKEQMRSQEHSVDVSHLSAGTYFIIFETSDKGSLKFVKK